FSRSRVLFCVPCLALFLLRGRARGLLRRRGARCLLPDRLDLDLGQAAAMPVATAIARAAPVLPDDHLLAQHVGRDLRGHLRALERVAELGVALAAQHDEVGVKRLALVVRQAVDEQALALADAVLLSAEGDDRVTVRFRSHCAKRAGSLGPLRLGILPPCAGVRALRACLAASSSSASAPPRFRTVPRRRTPGTPPAPRQAPDRPRRWSRSSSCGPDRRACRGASSASASPSSDRGRWRSRPLR